MARGDAFRADHLHHRRPPVPGGGVFVSRALSPAASAAQPPAASLAELLHSSPSTFRVEGEDGVLSLEELRGLAQGFAESFRSVRLGRGEPVAVLLPNAARTAAAYFGAWMGGIAVVPVSLSLPLDDQRYILERSECRVLLACEAVRAAAEALAPSLGAEGRVLWSEKVESSATRVETFVHPEDLAAIFFTSGTTGRPKGVMLSHRALVANAASCRAAFDFGPSDAQTTAIPLFHAFSLTVCLLLPALSGGRSRLFSPASIGAGLARDTGTLVGVPSLLGMLLAQKATARDMKRILSGGAALPTAVRRGLEAHFRIPVFEGYGTTECAPVVSVQRPGAEGPPDGVGRPLEGVCVEIRDETGRSVPAGEIGEIAVSGKNVMSGYYDLASVTAKRIRGGFFHTGDLGFLDPDGFLHIVDRVTDTIVRHGISIYPHEIEEVLGTHPEVQEAAVLGLPDGMGNEVPIAICVPTVLPPRAGLDAELLEYTAHHLPMFKVPVRVEFREDLPKTATGKVVKRALRQKWA